MNFRNGNKNQVIPFTNDWRRKKQLRWFYLVNLNWLLFNRITSHSIDFYILRVLCPNYTHFICTEFGKSFAVDFVFLSHASVNIAWFYLFVCLWFSFTTSNRIHVLKFFDFVYFFLYLLLLAGWLVWICFTQIFFYGIESK